MNLDDIMLSNSTHLQAELLGLEGAINVQGEVLTDMFGRGRGCESKTGDVKEKTCDKQLQQFHQLFDASLKHNTRLCRLRSRGN